MILEIEESEYRKRSELSQSSLKEFWKDSKGFYKKYILKEESPKNKEDDATHQAKLYGNVVDCLLTKEYEFDYKFQINNVELPKAQMFDFTKSLYKFTLLYTVDGKLMEEMDALYQMAYDEVGIKRDSLDKIKERFIVEGLTYYESLRNSGSTISITQKMYEQASLLVERLRSHPFCKGLINIKSEGDWEVIDQQMMTGEIEGVEMRGMLDRTIINHFTKKVYIWDYKIGANAEMFKYNYTKLGYYIQMAVYTLLMRQNYPEYIVQPLSFLAVDKTMYFDPLKYICSEDNLNQALNGFIRNGRKYPGLYEMLKEYKYCVTNSHYTSSAEAHKNNGNIKMEIF